MRLICPNCDAQYEVDDAAIPTAGRDVQCSSCGHGWFQPYPGVKTERAAKSALHQAPPASAPPVDAPVVNDITAADTVAAEVAAADIVVEDTAVADTDANDTSIQATDAADPVAPDVSVEDTAAADIAAAMAPDVPQSRQTDEAVLTVLREEAEREMIARRLEAGSVMETQADLGIDNAAATPAKLASARHTGPVDGEDPDLDAPVAEAEVKRELSRREMLPDIEEINSSLRPGDVAVNEDGESFEIVRRPPPRSGFRSGFVLMLVLAGIIIAVYVMAPRIAEQIPGAKPALDVYVAGVDGARAWIDNTTRSVVTSLRGLAGTDTPPEP
jgi:predicted Zn finger-like uncharacterized protein